jgi:hypothetical protein
MLRMTIGWVVVLAGMGWGCAPAGPPRDYYFGANGNDARGDGSLLQPFRSIAKANSISLKPGDRLLFEGGAAFEGNLALDEHDAGKPGLPVYVGSFGTGRATIRAGEGMGIAVRNAGGVVIENLIIEGAGPERNLGSGVLFLNERRWGNARLNFVRIKNVEAHGFGQEGIHIDAAGEAGFEDVRIEGCVAYENARCGIYVFGGRARSSYPHANVYVGNCVARDNPGDPDAPDENRSGSGIFLTGVDGAVVEQCAASGNGRRCRAERGGPMGIWASESNKVIIQACRSTGNRTGGRHDGGGFGLDGGMSNSILQYNYSSDNDGSGYGLFEYTGAKPWHDNVMRYNVSVDDGRRNGYAGIHVWNGDGGVRNAWIYHNTVVVGRVKSSEQPRALWIQSDTSNARVMNNIFATAPGLSVLDVAAGQEGIRFAGNCYWSGGRGVSIDWQGRAFSTLQTWSASTGQESGTGCAVDPHFDGRGEGAARFRLAAGSPLVDAAIPIPLNTGGRDFAATTLPQGKTMDVGAFESTTR